MSEINHFIEAFDLRGLHWAASFLGVMLCVYAMQSWSEGVTRDDNQFKIVNWMRRIALWMMALSLLWSLDYVETHPRWQPWPCDLASIISVDVFLAAALVGTYTRRRAHRNDPHFPVKT